MKESNFVKFSVARVRTQRRERISVILRFAEKKIGIDVDSIG